MDKNTSYIKIREQGGRITKIRSEIIKITSKKNCLISSTDLLSCLSKINIHPNRSTIYRELQFLTKNNVILKNTISGVDYYEMPHDHHHHHHLICMNCNSIIKVEMSNHLEEQEKQIAKQNKFNIINHSLEFYGYCHKCQV